MFQKEDSIRELFQDKNECLIVDEAEANMQNKQYINVLLSSLDTPNDIFLTDCLPLESSSNAYSSIILLTVDDVL